jgi:hypothetical protein
VAGVADDYCEHCDLALSQCVHGRPAPAPAPPAAPVRAAAAPRATGTARVPGTRATPVQRPVARRWTQPGELRPAILAVLQEAPEGLAQDDVFDRLEERIGDSLRPGDRDPNPQGELRWRAAARKARKELMDDGLLAPAGPGVWRLTDEGRATDLGSLD